MDSAAQDTRPTGKENTAVELHELARLYLNLYKNLTRPQLDLILHTDLQTSDWLEQTQLPTQPNDPNDTYRVIQTLADHHPNIPPIERQLHQLVAQIRQQLNDHQQTHRLMWPCPHCGTHLYKHPNQTIQCPEPQCNVIWQWSDLENVVP